MADRRSAAGSAGLDGSSTTFLDLSTSVFCQAQQESYGTIRRGWKTQSWDGCFTKSHLLAMHSIRLASNIPGPRCGRVGRPRYLNDTWCYQRCGFDGSPPCLATNTISANDIESAKLGPTLNVSCMRKNEPLYSLKLCETRIFDPGFVSQSTRDREHSHGCLVLQCAPS
jgi:hypothetical protein